MSLLEHYLREDERSLLTQATRIDKTDRILGPLASTLQLTGRPELTLAGSILSVAELALLKVPFVFYYLRTTKDYDALTHWLPKEIISNIFPYGDYLDIMHTYKNRTNSYLENKIEDEKRREQIKALT